MIQNIATYSMTRVLQSSSLEFFRKQYTILTKKADLDHYENYLQITTPPRHSIQIKMHNRNSHILLFLSLKRYPFDYEKEYIVRDSDCNRLIAEYAATIIEVSIMLDLSCILTSHYYAYPFHSFVWRCLSLKNADRKRKQWIQNKIALHNYKNKYQTVSQQRFFENDIATFFRDCDIFTLFD